MTHPNPHTSVRKPRPLSPSSAARKLEKQVAWLRTADGERYRAERSAAMIRAHAETPDLVRKPVGVPRGSTRTLAALDWAKANTSARETMEALHASSVVSRPTTSEETAACEALETALAILRSPMALRERLTAGRLILAFTRARPAIRQTVSLGTAEAWLSEVATATDHQS